MWSFGCILAELYTASLSFQRKRMEQLALIMQVRGVPPEGVME